MEASDPPRPDLRSLAARTEHLAPTWPWTRGHRLRSRSACRSAANDRLSRTSATSQATFAPRSVERDRRNEMQSWSYCDFDLVLYGNGNGLLYEHTRMYSHAISSSLYAAAAVFADNPDASGCVIFCQAATKITDWGLGSPCLLALPKYRDPVHGRSGEILDTQSSKHWQPLATRRSV
jgi:hypothetical protein